MTRQLELSSFSFVPPLSYIFHHPGAKEASQETKVSSREEQTQSLAQDDPPQETEHTTTYTAGRAHSQSPHYCWLRHLGKSECLETMSLAMVVLTHSCLLPLSLPLHQMTTRGTWQMLFIVPPPQGPHPTGTVHWR